MGDAPRAPGGGGGPGGGMGDGMGGVVALGWWKTGWIETGLMSPIMAKGVGAAAGVPPKPAPADSPGPPKRSAAELEGAAAAGVGAVAASAPGAAAPAVPGAGASLGAGAGAAPGAGGPGASTAGGVSPRAPEGPGAMAGGGAGPGAAAGGGAAPGVVDGSGATAGGAGASASAGGGAAPGASAGPGSIAGGAGAAASAVVGACIWAEGPAADGWAGATGTDDGCGRTRPKSPRRTGSASPLEGVLQLPEGGMASQAPIIQPLGSGADRVRLARDGRLPRRPRRPGAFKRPVGDLQRDHAARGGRLGSCLSLHAVRPDPGYGKLDQQDRPDRWDSHASCPPWLFSEILSILSAPRAVRLARISAIFPDRAASESALVGRPAAGFRSDGTRSLACHGALACSDVFFLDGPPDPGS